MFCSFESVTVGVSSLESSVNFCRDRLGLRVIYDTRASVGLLSAWRRPVHDSVRLVEMGSASGKHARIRLACYEDSRLAPGTVSSQRDLNPPVNGPWAVEFRSATKPGTAAANRLSVLPGPDALPFLAPASAPEASTSALEFNAVWIGSADVRTSAPFYEQVLGFKSDGGAQQVPSPLNVTQLFTYRAPKSQGSQFVIAHFSDTDVGSRRSTSMAVGQIGFNLFSFRCEDLDELAKRVDAIGVEPVTRPTHVGLPFGYPGRVMIVPGPNGELFEFDEITE
jgi:catechol 2,3-dioxygenase-like lactoylglutathione lyase family enzyme